MYGVCTVLFPLGELHYEYEGLFSITCVDMIFSGECIGCMAVCFGVML